MPLIMTVLGAFSAPPLLGGWGMRCMCVGGRWGGGCLQTQMSPPDLTEKQKED